MDLLRTAVVDITTLVATCHALKTGPLEGEGLLDRKLRGRLRREIKRGTVAYIDALARSRRIAVDDAVLAQCRAAAEARMAQAIAGQELLARLMVSEPGSLAGLAASRQDLWQLAHLSIQLRCGMDQLQRRGPGVDADAAAADLAGRLRRRLRKALVAYARTTLRVGKPMDRLIAPAREAALAAIGQRGAADAGRLAEFDPRGDPAHDYFGRGVNKALSDLALDWQRPRADSP